MLPQSVKVLGKRYAVLEKQPGCGGSNLFGEANHRALKIEVCTDQADDQKRDTLLHEIIHAVEYSMHLEFEERQVHALAAGLLAVMRDNRDLVAWLMQEDAAE